MPDSTPRPLGRIAEHDPRSLAYAARPETTTRVSVRHKRNAPIFDQGDLGSCTGNACLGAIATSPLYDDLAAAGHLPDFVEGTAVKLYSLATTLDSIAGSYPPDDTGSSGTAVAKAAQKDGWLSGYTHAFTLDEALNALCKGPVITGVDWYDGFDTPTPGGECVLAGSIRGGHELVVDEIDVENQRVWFTNSWSTSWGIAGRAWWSWETWGKLLAHDGDATILIPVTAPAPVPNPGPGAASFPVSAAVAARIAAVAAHGHMTGDQWLEHHLRAHFKMPVAS